MDFAARCPHRSVSGGGMNGVALHSIELCAGVGMLGEGVRTALEHFGIGHRTVCYVEREATAAAQLAALMEAGAIDQAPIWSDLLTFDGAAWRGRVDCVIAGFPCQDLSVAGRRAGLDGKRSGLFFSVADIADDCGAWLIVLENVSGITSATASVVDETEGELFERAAARVLGELADRGWDAECLLIRASDVGANHQRERWFCIAWRMGDARLQHVQLQQRRVWPKHPSAGNDMGDAGRKCDGANEPIAIAECRRASDVGVSGPRMADAARDGWHEGRSESARQFGRSDVAEHGGAVGNAERPERRAFSVCGRSGGTGQDSERQATSRARIGNAPLGDAARIDGNEWQRFGQRKSAGARRQSRTERSGVAMGDANKQRAQQPDYEVGAESRERSRNGACRAGGGLLDLFAPGPIDDRWPGIIANRSDLAPAIEPGVRVLVDGLAYVVDESRNHQLRQVGNGVVPLQAAVAIVTLARRAGLFE
ncbi:DNA cytosine methyltransferase [Burkholderia pseudomallei]|uniref:DNA cytosine methyltransferase n=1 Tax=Burkholderia pseudomallei TaxID=28450 RepID=UPI001CC2CD7F|nr:DNA cytosine methyltransferase [Burkholderia pseudomallei]MCW0024668.1 DNA cytosine methyltransferase [Burkholderia pseudomallei]MCW0156029.1 DNA cytosine methyltransferase [Burkholderia pseudomallei]MCW0169543.1 DNA cytosine methyltransferase [Burkholderia pseudomallei]